MSRTMTRSSDAVTERTGVRHESPQVIVLRDGKAVWSASQFRIKADDVAHAIAGGDTRAEGRGVRARYPFTAPAAMPCTMKRWARK